MASVVGSNREVLILEALDLAVLSLQGVAEARGLYAEVSVLLKLLHMEGRDATDEEVLRYVEPARQMNADIQAAYERIRRAAAQLAFRAESSP